MARARCPDWPTLSAEAVTSPVMTSSRYRQSGSPVFQVDRRRKGTSLEEPRSCSFTTHYLPCSSQVIRSWRLRMLKGSRWRTVPSRLLW